ncbi:DUF4911 domain-containing protein [Mesoaciditoga sp.]
MSSREYDVYVKISKEDVHTLNYILEAEDNLINVRHIDPASGLLKIIVIDDALEDVLKLLHSLKDELHLKVVKYEPNRGIL